MITLSLILAGQISLASDRAIMVDIPPLTHLFSANEYTNVDTLFAEGDDPHHFSLRPADVARLAKTETLVYLGKSVLPQVEKAALSANADMEIIALDEDMENFDPHFWLSPVMLQALSENEALTAALVAADEALEENEYPYKIVVAHQAYDPFINAYGVQSLGAFTDEHDHGAGTHDHHDIEAEIDENTCFISSSTEPNVAQEKIAESKGAKVVRHDPLGWDIEGEGIAFFTEYFAKIGRVFSECEN